MVVIAGARVLYARVRMDQRDDGETNEPYGTFLDTGIGRVYLVFDLDTVVSRKYIQPVFVLQVLEIEQHD